MKSEKFASARHFSAISSHIYARLSLNHAEYPRYLEDKRIRHNFAPRKVGVSLIIDSYRRNPDQWLQRPLPIGEDGKRICWGGVDIKN